MTGSRITHSLASPLYGLSLHCVPNVSLSLPPAFLILVWLHRTVSQSAHRDCLVCEGSGNVSEQINVKQSHKGHCYLKSIVCAIAERKLGFVVFNTLR